MKMPKNISETKINKNNNEELNIIEFDKLENFDYKFNNYENEKDFNRYIKQLESIIRNSLEYKRYIRYLKENQNLTKCSFFQNIDVTKLEKTKIEFHHYPFNLYEIVYTIINEQSNFLCDPVNSFLVCNEVMKLHYENKIGLIPLSKTIHELAHDGEIFINLNEVFGDYKSFIEDYKDFINSDLFEPLNKLEEMSNNHSEINNKDILAKNFQQILIKDRNIDYFEDKNEKKLA